MIPKYKERFKIFGHVYDSSKNKTILIKDNRKRIFVIYNDRKNNKK